MQFLDEDATETILLMREFDWIDNHQKFKAALYSASLLFVWCGHLQRRMSECPKKNVVSLNETKSLMQEFDQIDNHQKFKAAVNSDSLLFVCLVQAPSEKKSVQIGMQLFDKDTTETESLMLQFDWS